MFVRFADNFKPFSKLWLLVTSFLCVCAIATSVVLTRPSKAKATGDSSTTYVLNGRIKFLDCVTPYSGVDINCFYRWLDANDQYQTHDVSATSELLTGAFSFSYQPANVKLGSTVELKFSWSTYCIYLPCDVNELETYEDLEKTWAQGHGGAGDILIYGCSGCGM